MADLVIVLMNFMEIVKDLGLDLRIGSLVFRQAIPELGGRILRVANFVHEKCSQRVLSLAEINWLIY